MIQRKKYIRSIHLLLVAFISVFVLSCSLLAVMQVEHGMTDGMAAHVVHEHSDVPLSLPIQPITVAVVLVLSFGITALYTLAQSILSRIFVRWHVLLRDYRRRIGERVLCFFNFLFQQGILHPKSF